MGRAGWFSGWSLTARVVALSSLWALIAIILLGWILVGLFRSNADRNFSELQVAQFYTLVGAISADGTSAPRGNPDLGDPSFREVGSGWYWRVFPIENPEAAIGSRSLGEAQLPSPSNDEIPFDNQFSRRFFVDGPYGERLRILESEIDGGDGTVLRFQVAGNESEFNSTIAGYARQTSALLGMFALGVIAINALIILAGLKPLDRIREALFSIREGKAQKLDGVFPREIQPLADEMNALIDNNKRILDRARTQVGNLAHSLKTPLSVLVNEADTGRSVSATIVREQARSMQFQVQHYLDRARIAAQRESVVFRTDAKAATEKLVSVMRKLNPERKISFHAFDSAILFAGEKEDFDEILGNLLENATKWAKSKVDVEIKPQEATGDGEKPRFLLTVADDGPGISPDKRAEALQRGKRLDESVPGTGLGLSIVCETVASYGGTLSLDTSQGGGLKVSVSLPRLAA